MPMYDFRTKPNTEWTFYVVDHLPTMANLYRYDTIGEAIAKFKELAPNQRSAIGSSIEDTHEIDHVHRIDGLAVLVTDIDRMKSPLWRESKSIASAVAAMKSALNITYELSTNIFFNGVSVAIPISLNSFPNEKYFNDKKLNPVIWNRPLSGINEVFVEGQGWVKCEDFLKKLNDRKWTREGGYPVPFVNQLNIRYADNNGHYGQADITPQDFIHLKSRYEKSLDLRPTLEDQIYAAELNSGNPDISGKTIINTDKGR